MNPSELRYCVGVILSEGESEPDNAHLSTFLEHGFKELVLPAVDHAVLTTFPFNNTVSIFIGVARVYPKLAEYIKVIFHIQSPCLLSLKNLNFLIYIF